MSHNNLQNYYRSHFGLTHKHGQDPEYLDNMIVFEKDILVSMIMESISKQ